jgi:hypothetical protein
MVFCKNHGILCWKEKYIMYKISKLVHFRSTLILNESNKTHRRKPTVGPWHRNSMSQNRMHDHGENNNKKTL